jgi:hypothetical protein
MGCYFIVYAVKRLAVFSEVPTFVTLPDCIVMCCTLESDSSANSYWFRFHISAFVFLQGHDTTSAGMSWALYLLGLHPDVQVYNYLIAEFTGTRTQNVTSAADIQEASHPHTGYCCCIFL